MAVLFIQSTAWVKKKDPTHSFETCVLFARNLLEFVTEGEGLIFPFDTELQIFPSFKRFH
jgi:hypothetical protein